MKKNSFVEGTIVAYIAILLTKILGAIYVIPFYKIIGEDGGVLYSYAYNIYNLFLNISTSGIPTAVSIIISEYNALKMFNEREYTYKIANRTISIFAFIAFIIMFIFAKPIAQFLISDLKSVESIVLVIRIISFCLLIIPFLSVTRGYLQGNKYVSISSFSQVIEQISRIFIVLVGSYIAINILNYNIDIGVSVALSGTVIGGICAFLFLKYKIYKNKDSLKFGIIDKKNLSVTYKDILKKIIIYAIPVIIISITQNIYEIVDQKLIIKGLHIIGYKTEECELLSSIVITWAPKICMVINALAIGLCTSIIPFIVDSYIKKDNKTLNDKFNQAINTIIFIGIPLALFLILFSKESYYIFYDNSKYGSIILCALAIVSILFSIHMVINMILQGMKKYKIIYLNTIVGIVLNTLLDIPLILLLNKIGFYPYLGTLFSTAIGQTVSILIVVISLKKEFKFSYKSVITTLKKMLLPLFLMTFIMILFRILINYINLTFNISYIIILLELCLSAIISILIYIFVSYKNKSMQFILGEDIIDKVLLKLKIKH